MPAQPALRALHPRYWPVHLLAVLALSAAVGLGVWQYGAWSTHRDEKARDLTGTAAVPLADALGADQPFPADRIGQPVRVSGTWVPSGSFLVSGREHDGRDGYWAVTPLAVGPGAKAPALEIVRGWSPTRAGVPAAPTGAAELTAWLQPPEGDNLTDPDPDDDVLPQLRIADAIQRVDRDLYGAYGVLDDRDPVTNAGTTGLTQASLEQLPDAGRFTAVRNLLYAVEWWFFGGFAVYIWWRWLREEVLDDGDGTSERPATEAPRADSLS